MDIKAIISDDLGIPTSLIDEALARARLDVKKFVIPKRNGQKRVILQPSKKLKTIQYWLIINIFKKLNVHSAAFAYRDNLSILENAEVHKGNKYFLKMDLKDFFPSINYSDLIPLIASWHSKETPSWTLSKNAEVLIRLSCFYQNDFLPVGYPSSPIISNVVMYKFDTEISNLINDMEKFGEVIYTRYADDLVFSTNKQGACNLLLKAITDYIAKSESPKLVVNTAKTKFGSSSGGTASVTGLKICNEGRITIHRKQKDHIRLLLSLYGKSILNPEEYNSLLGHLSYIHHVDPAFYSKLQSKYFMQIAELRAANKAS